MYFDAFGSRPLTRPYYDPSVVTLLTRQEAEEVSRQREGPGFTMLFSDRMFRDSALTELEALTERDRFNLPDRVDSPRRIGEERVYLPLYLVRAVADDGRPRYFAYTRASDTADPDITDICQRSPEVVGVIETEEGFMRSERVEERAREWSNKHGGGRLQRLRNGMLRVTLPASAFRANAENGAPSLSRLGSFVVQGRDFFQVWCEDERTRQRALLERIDSYLGSRMRVERADVTDKLGRFARQLELGQLDIPTLRRMASRVGKRDLVSHLDGIA